MSVSVKYCFYSPILIEVNKFDIDNCFCNFLKISFEITVCLTGSEIAQSQHMYINNYSVLRISLLRDGFSKIT